MSSPPPLPSSPLPTTHHSSPPSSAPVPSLSFLLPFRVEWDVKLYYTIPYLLPFPFPSLLPLPSPPLEEGVLPRNILKF